MKSRSRLSQLVFLHPPVAKGAPQVVVLQLMRRRFWRRWEGKNAGSEVLVGREHVLNFANIDDGSGVIGDIDVVIVLSADRSLRRGVRLSNPRRGARALVGRMVNALVEASQVHPERRNVEEGERGHGGVLCAFCRREE